MIIIIILTRAYRWSGRNRRTHDRVRRQLAHLLPADTAVTSSQTSPCCGVPKKSVRVPIVDADDDNYNVPRRCLQSPRNTYMLFEIDHCCRGTRAYFDELVETVRA